MENNSCERVLHLTWTRKLLYGCGELPRACMNKLVLVGCARTNSLEPTVVCDSIWVSVFNHIRER